MSRSQNPRLNVEGQCSTQRSSPITPALTPNSSGSRSFPFGPTHSWRQVSAQHPDTPWEGRRRKTKQNHLSPVSRHAMGDKGRQRETKQDHPSPASRHAMGDKGRQGETRQSDLSPASRQTRGDKGRQRAEIILAQHRFYARIENPSQQSCLGKKEVKSHPLPMAIRSKLVQFGPDMPARCFRLAAVQQGAKGAHLKGRTHSSHREVGEIPSTP